jgi:hypothetical protein
MGMKKKSLHYINTKEKLMHDKKRFKKRSEKEKKLKK